jgi:uncharacterized protein (DUF342 family)
LTTPTDEPIQVAEKRAATYVLRLFLAPDNLTCTAMVAPGPEPGGGPAAEEILGLLAESGIVEGIDPGAVAEAAGYDPAGFPPVGIDVAHGVAPVAPHDGYVELQVRPDTGTASYAVKADGSVDFYNRSDYDQVGAGQEIGVWHPPRAGRPGVTVTGHAIPVPSPSAPKITFNKGVKLDRESNRIKALTGGRVLFVGDALSVEEEYLVQGDVNLAVGNIRNSGFVIIAGDVGDNFSVTGDKGIRVGGIVGAARLKSDGDITVGGVTGKGKGQILCGGSVHARFLSEVEVECRGDVVVESEIRGSTIRAGGMILIPNGVIAAGECIAGRGIEVKTAGSTMGVLTKLSSGTDYRMRKQLDALRERLRLHEKEIARLESALGPEPPDEATLARLSPSRRESLEMQYGKLTAARTGAILLRDEIALVNVENDPASNAMINVRGDLFENTVVNLWHADVRIAEARKGPISIIENTLDGTLRFLPLHPLKKNARDIEAAILAASPVPAG